MSAAMARWHTVPAEDLTWHVLDGELVVHNAQSGSTHLLEPLAGEVLRALAAGSPGLSVRDLVLRMRGDSAIDEPADWYALIEAILSEFQRLGLAERERA